MYFFCVGAQFDKFKSAVSDTEPGQVSGGRVGASGRGEVKHSRSSSPWLAASLRVRVDSAWLGPAALPPSPQLSLSSTLMFLPLFFLDRRTVNRLDVLLRTRSATVLPD